MHWRGTPVCKDMQFSVAACHQVRVVCEAQVTCGSPDDGNEGVVVVKGIKGFSHNVFQEVVEQQGTGH